MNLAIKPFRPNPVLIVLILGLVAFFFYVYFFIDPAQVISILSKTNLAIYAGAFVAYSFFVILSSLVWQQLLSRLSIKISKRKSLLFTWVRVVF